MTATLTRLNSRIREQIERVPLLPVLLLGVVALDLYQLPEALNFPCFAFGDCGGNFTAQYLIAHGARIGIDFGYHYGLLGLLFGRLWFLLAGSSPYAYVAANFILNLAIAWGLARIAHALDLRAEGKLLVVAALGYTISFQPYPNFAHMLEATLLVWAIAEQSRGARLNAIALAAIAALAKPAMAYLYGALLIGFSVLDKSRANTALNRHNWKRVVVRGALAWVAVAAVLAAVYGPGALIDTVLPLIGARAYRLLHYGFFSSGAFRVYLPSARNWVWSGAAFWILAGLCVLWFGARSLWSLWKRSEQARSRADEIAGSCAIMHVSFVMFFFAAAWSSFYYSYLLVIGVAAAAERSFAARTATLALCILAVLGYGTTIRWTLHDWIRDRPSAESAWLWESPEMRTEWAQVLHLSRGRRAVVLTRLGGASLLFPQFEPPVRWALVPGLATKLELRNEVKQISQASIVVLTTLYAHTWPNGVPPFPQLRQALGEFCPIYSGRFFSVLKACPSAPLKRPDRRKTRPAVSPSSDGASH